MNVPDALRRANSGWIGARFVVRFDVVRTILKTLRQELATSPPPLSRSRLCSYHNCYVIYVYLFQGLSSSLRAVTNPTGLVVARERSHEVFQREPQSTETVLAGLADKDSPFFQRARLIDLSGALEQQLGHFERHTTALIQRLGLFSALESCPAESRQFFAIDDTCKPIVVNRTWIESQMTARGFPLPANFHRGFLRTELLARGCPAQSVDALLGHASRGESPFGTHSTFDFLQHRKVIRRHLNHLHEQLGLAPVRSRLVPDAAPDTPFHWASPFADMKPRLKRAPFHAAEKVPDMPRSDKSDLEAIWDKTRANATADDKAQLPAFRVFLLTCDNPHARYLSGRPPLSETERTDAPSAIDLEQRLLVLYAERKLGLVYLASWFRILARVIRNLSAIGGEIHATRLIAFVRDQSSPFSPELASAIPVVGLWRSTFEQWLATLQADLPSIPHEHWAAAIALSSIIFGCLLDKRKVSQLLDEHLRAGSTRLLHATNGYAFFDFEVPANEAGIFQLNRWFLDPVTEMLFLRAPALSCSVSLGDLDLPLRKVFKAAGVPPRLRPTSWGQVISMAATWWSAHGAQSDVAGVKRVYCSHSVDRDSWTRMFGVEVLTASSVSVSATAMAEIAPPSADSPPDVDPDRDVLADGDQAVECLDAFEEDIQALHPWLEVALGILRHSDPTLVPAEILALRDVQSNSAVHLYLSWLHHLLTAKRERRGPMSTRGAKRVFMQSVFRLLIVLDDLDPRSLSEEELIWAYAQVIEECEPSLPGTLIGLRLRQFHDYLSKHHSVAPLSCPDAIFGTEAVPWMVDAHAISFDEYEMVLHWLATHGRPIMSERDRRICQLVVTLTFRTGLRPHELFGALRGDVHILRGIFLLIRPRTGHGLKSRSATRNLPIGHLLTAEERRNFYAWLSRECPTLSDTALASANSGLLFEPEPGCNAATFRARIVTLVNKTLALALQAPYLHLYHLRHSYGTWTDLRLSAHDRPLIPEILAKAPGTIASLKTSSRLRTVFLGKCGPADRRYGYAVARTLGHLSPATSK